MKLIFSSPYYLNLFFYQIQAQIVFLQSEGANMLKALHLEIDKLGHQLRGNQSVITLQPFL